MLNSYEYLNLTSKVDNIKLKDFLSESGISSRLIRASIREKNIYLNKIQTFENKIISKGDTVSIKFIEEELNAEPQYKKLDIVYEDEDLLVVNKEANMPTHTSKGHRENTLLNYVAGYFVENDIKRKVRFVNRLDKDTTGLVIVAKNSYTHYDISKQFGSSMIKKYIAISNGIFEKKEGFIEEPIYREGESIIREVNEKGKSAKTQYRVLGEKNNLSLVELRLYSGRTHQIRVHLKYIGHPILGDTLYNESSKLINRQALHSSYMKFSNPRNQEEIELKADIPKDMNNIIDTY
ncbi:23S rRNA pseudouridine1911/1915/1917 synthase [Anaerosphaera aminiphila DSM 21120]|uniref:Pseudouridine synthase n=1 Tax=Anaerosphaera aminiphila DSM 21120 TaxID=1120995 RepID=A0A1M5QJY4_9FIRM|nr:RluA family pseudouridine synthase [Anaerosphaera aminiphila]SHH14434.1 23S rRNA pseudouridine1911/1915/1917 synthase [Anaerosphaera aminiphila DSM 21120]